MEIIKLSKEEILNLFFQKDKIVNFGIYGYMLPYQNDYIKLFHKKLPDTFINPTPSNLDREIKLLQTIQTLTGSNPLKSIKEKMTILKKIKELLEELQNNNIYITNFNETNIIIRKSDHDVKIVNLDTSTTKVKSPEHISKLTLIKKAINQKYNILTKTFLN